MPQHVHPLLHEIKDDAQRPHVRLRGISLPGNHFRRDVVECAARIVQLLLREDQLRETEVANLHVVQVLITQNVLRLG